MSEDLGTGGGVGASGEGDNVSQEEAVFKTPSARFITIKFPQEDADTETEEDEDPEDYVEEYEDYVEDPEETVEDAEESDEDDDPFLAQEMAELKAAINTLKMKDEEAATMNEDDPFESSQVQNEEDL